jgi:hypothetical protein
MEVDLRVTLQTHDEALIYLTLQGMRHAPPDVNAALWRGEPVDASRYYFRSTGRFETAAPQYAYLNQLLVVGSGEMKDGAALHTLEEVL